MSLPIPWSSASDDSSSSEGFPKVTSWDLFKLQFNAWQAQCMAENRLIDDMIDHMLTKEYKLIKKREEAERRRNSRKRVKKDLPSGEVAEGKARLAIESNAPSRPPGRSNKPSSSTTSSCNSSQPSMCLGCGEPKIYSYYHPLGMVCPTCPLNAKKKGSIVKDKGKSKRVKAQSSNLSSD